MAVIKYLPYFMWIVVFLLVDLICYDLLKQDYLKFGFTPSLFISAIFLLFITFALPGIALSIEYQNDANRDSGEVKE